MTNSDRFCPNWTSAPGDTIVDVLHERGIYPDQFAELMECSIDDVRDLLLGRSTITISMARRLSQVLGASLEFWMSRDFQFREDVKRIHGGGQEWLLELPLGDMINFGWLKPTPHPTDELSACLKYFNVSDISEWHLTYRGIQEMSVFRTSASYDSRAASVAAWLRQGEIQADNIECASWDPQKFSESLPHLRQLTRQKDPAIFIPQLQTACSESGVAVVIVRCPNGCRASGATRFISSNKAVLQLSSRFLTDDHFWFTFFHETGHLLLHSETSFFPRVLGESGEWILEGLESSKSTKEKEADQFAAHTLVPPKFEQQLVTLHAEPRSIIRFAKKLGISPGIVVGQLQHREKIGYHQFNGLKRRFKWEDYALSIRERV